MKIHTYIPATLCFFMILGILFGYSINPDLSKVLAYLFGALTILSLVYWHANKIYTKKYYFNIVAYILFFIIGISAITIQNSQFQKKHYSHFIKDKNIVILTISKPLKSNKYYHKYEAKIIQLNKTKVVGKLLLNIKKNSTTKRLNVGENIQVKTIFKTINKPLNLYQFNYQDYLKTQQIYHQITVMEDEIYLLPNKTKNLHEIVFRIRKKINKSLVKYHFKKDELAIINALLLGQKQDVSKELLQSYAGAGAMHILAVSGLHIGILLLLLNTLFKPLEMFKNGKIIKLLLVIVLLWLYALLAGFSPSIIRAVTMFTAIAIGVLLNKETNILHNLFLSMFLLLLVNPLYLFSVGFQLSYLAVFSIVYFYPLLTSWYHPKLWLFKKLGQLLAISISAQLGVLPISLYYFHQFPSLFFVTSLVIIPLLGFILAYGILVIILALLGILPQFLATFFGLIIHKMNAFISFIANQETFLLKQISFSILLLISSYVFLVFVFRFLKLPSINKMRLVLVSILLFQVVLLYEKWQIQNTNEFIVFHKNKTSIVLFRKGEKVNILHSLDSITIQKNKAIQDYKIGTGKIEFNYKPIQNIYKIAQDTLIIIDSLAVYNLPKLHPKVVLLRDSPKINLERLIQTLKPKIIIADASNYKTFKKRWQQTCKKYKVIFYNTSVKGAYQYKYKN